MADDWNEVTVVFTNGDEINVDEVARLVGADWVTASIVHPRDDPDDDTLDIENVVIQTDDIRYIKSDEVTPAGDDGSNWRVHHTREDHNIAGTMTDAWKGQHQLHPDDDPSAYSESEDVWPPEGGDPRYSGGVTVTTQ
jgi:hypothetical protein